MDRRTNSARMGKQKIEIQKIEIQVSRQADGERWAVGKVDVEKCLAAGDCHLMANGSTVTVDRREK